MATEFRNKMRDVMNDAWRMFRITGESFSEIADEAKNGSVLLSESERRNQTGFWHTER